MKHTGRKPASTREQRDEVLRRVAAGESRRSVAASVFGDEALKGRVDRIVRAKELGGRRGDVERLLRTVEERPEALVPADSEDVPTLAELFGLYARELRRRLRSGERVTAGELEAFARLEQRLHNMRTVERLNRIVRGERADEDESAA